MKKLFLLLLGLIAVFGFVGCNKGGSEIEVNLDEFIASPTNLSISGTTLSWDAVPEAAGYIVYANGEEADKVSGTSYNFSAIAENGMIFQVRTRAPRGMQDSPLSVSVGYVVNVAAEITAVQAAMGDMGIDVPDGFAEELVAKGMLGSQVEAMGTAFQTFTESMSEVQGLDDAYTALNTMLAEVDNIEALVSAFVKTMLPELLQQRINEMQDQIDMYQSWIDEDEWYAEWYQPEIDSLQSQIDVFEELITEIETNADDLVLAITSTINYFLSIEEMMTQDLIDSITELSQTSDIKQLNVSELVLVKDEMVNILRDTMPTQEEMTLIFQVYDLLLAVSGNYVQIDYTVENYEGKMAAQALYSIEAFINFIDSMDETFFNNLIDAIEFQDSNMKVYMEVSVSNGLTPSSGAEILILFIKQFAEFKADNQDLLDTMNAVFTDDEKETMFNESLAALESAGQLTTEAVTLLDAFDFQILLDLQASMGDAFDAVLDAFVQTDGEVIRLAVEMNGFRQDWWEDVYYNDVTGDEFANYGEFNHERQLVTYELAGQVAILVEAAVNAMSSEDYQNVMTLVSTVVSVAETQDAFGDMGIDVAPLLVVFDSFIANSGADQFELIQNLLSYVVDEDVFGQLYDLEVAVYQHLVDTYGADFYDGYAYYDDDYEQYAQIILMAKLYDGFMTSGNRGLVDDIINQFAIAMTDDNVQTLTGLTDQQIADIQDGIDTLLDTVKSSFRDIKGYNANSLSASAKEDIDALLAEIQAAAMAIGDNLMQ